jgi:hypothetical protein
VFFPGKLFQQKSNVKPVSPEGAFLKSALTLLPNIKLAKKDCQGQQLKFVMNISKLMMSIVCNIGPRKAPWSVGDIVLLVTFGSGLSLL